MKLTLPHHTTQENAIKTINDKLDELLAEEFPGVDILDPTKEWDENIMRFSFTVQKMLFALHFEGNVIVTDEEAILEGELPGMLLTFISEEKIKELLKKEFNKLFNINE